MKLWTSVIVTAMVAGACSGGGSDRAGSPPTLPEGELSADLPAYLASVSDIHADLVAEQSTINASGSDPVALATLWRDAGNRFEELDPPEEAADLHNGWVDLADGFVDAFEDFIVGSADPETSQAALTEFAQVTAELGSEAIDIDLERGLLTAFTLASFDDPLARYLAETMELQARAAPVSDRMFGAIAQLTLDPELAVATILEAADEFDVLRDAWDELTPPPEAQDLHDRRVQLLVNISTVFRELIDTVESQSAPSPELLSGLQELGQRSPLMNTEVSQFTSDALRNLDTVAEGNPSMVTDYFNGGVDAGWAWAGGDPSLRSLTASPGFLSMTTTTTGAGAGVHILARRPSTSDYEIETKLTFQPFTNFQGAGLAVLGDDNNRVSVIRAFCDLGEGQCVDDGIYFDNVVDGEFTENATADLPAGAGDVYLRLRHEAGTYTAFYSIDGTDWTELGSRSRVLTSEVIGLMAAPAQAPTDEPIARFSYFSEIALG